MSPARRLNNNLVKTIFFGNYFYGICAVALSIEASLQQEFPLNSLVYYALVFCGAVFYYTVAYLGEPSPNVGNERTRWYAANMQRIKRRQWVLGALILILAVLFAKDIWWQFLWAPAFYWFMVFVFPVVAALYYGISTKRGGLNLRRVGWLKPFIIGFTWAGVVTVYPVLFYNIQESNEFEPAFKNGLLFVKNFMFVSVLCILFDIKDYATDANQRLKTFVVNTGLRQTIFYIIIPLSAIGLGSFLVYAMSHHFSTLKILLNTIPFILLIAVAYSLHRRRSILYYLIIIDGLMLVKALCGSIAMAYF